MNFFLIPSAKMGLGGKNKHVIKFGENRKPIEKYNAQKTQKARSGPCRKQKEKN